MSTRRPKYCTSETQSTKCHEFEQSLEEGSGCLKIELFVVGAFKQSFHLVKYLKGKGKGAPYNRPLRHRG